jgi:hypothetical protein
LCWTHVYLGLVWQTSKTQITWVLNPSNDLGLGVMPDPSGGGLTAISHAASSNLFWFDITIRLKLFEFGMTTKYF